MGEFVENGEVNYFNLCLELKETGLFYDMFEHDGVEIFYKGQSDEQIKKELFNQIDDYMKICIEASKETDDLDVVYFASVSLIYICCNTYPGGDQKYIKFDELYEYLVCLLKRNDIQIDELALRLLSNGMFDCLSYDWFKYNNGVSLHYNALESCPSTWVTKLVKLFYNLNGLFGYGIPSFHELENGINSWYLLMYNYLDSLPHSLYRYIWHYSEELADRKERVVGFQKDDTMVQMDSSIGMLGVRDIHVIPMLTKYTDHVYRDDMREYRFFTDYKGFAQYYNLLIEQINQRYCLNLENGKENFERIIKQINPQYGEKLCTFIEKLENSNTKDYKEVPYRVRSYFYSAESLYQVMKEANIKSDIEVSFMCINYIKGIETFLADSIKVILDSQNIDFTDLKYSRGSIKSLEKLECASLVYLITENKDDLTNVHNDWGYIKHYNNNSKLGGFAGEFNREWVQKIRNGKMHKSPVLVNYPIKDAPEGVRIATYKYLTEIFSKLKINV